MASQVTAVASPSDIPEISREELRRRLHDPSLKIVDVLPESSYVEMHIPGALSMPLETVVDRARQLLPDRDAEIVVYCGKLTCDRSEHALEQLHQLGYSNVRDYRAGIADWIEAGEPTESVSDANAESADGAAHADAVPDSRAPAPFGPPLTISASGEVGGGQARVSQMRKWDKSVLDLIQRRSTLQLFLIWMGMIVLCGLGYWLGALYGEHGLVEAGRPVGGGLGGLASALYFSFVTATSVGYGDIVPIGMARAIAVSEAITALLIFGAVVAKFVSHRQDELVADIHRITFDERLDRVQGNMHMVITELLAISAVVEGPQPQMNRIVPRLESASLVFQSELRTSRDLLYQPRLIVEEGVLSAILAALSSTLNVFADLLASMPPEFSRSQPFDIVLGNITRISREICGECVPHSYTPRLIFWMDRIQATARRIK